MKNMLLRDLGKYFNPGFILVDVLFRWVLLKQCSEWQPANLKWTQTLKKEKHTPLALPFFSPFHCILRSLNSPLTREHILLHANVSCTVINKCSVSELPVYVTAFPSVGLKWKRERGESLLIQHADGLFFQIMFRARVFPWKEYVNSKILLKQ